jgi:AcrR family transcriptional regulator
MERKIRVPRQKRSIEKKNNIINAAYKIFNEKGYTNTNTVEIAKEAGISIGSVYAYFKDKKDIFIETLKKYSSNIIELILKKFEEIPLNEDLLDVIKIIINISIESHNISKNLHDEIMALSYLDPDVKKHFKILQKETMDKVLNQLEKRNIKIKNEKEKLFLIASSVDALCHEYVYIGNVSFDKDIAVNECAHMIKYLLTDETF